jgi:hypothetical protein
MKEMQTKKELLEDEEKKDDKEAKKAEDDYIRQAKEKGIELERSEGSNEKSFDEDDPQKIWDDYLAENIEFSDEDEYEAMGQYTRSVPYKPPKDKNKGE